MERKEFKEVLERHKNQIDASIKHLQVGLDHFNKRSSEFYEYIESKYDTGIMTNSPGKKS